jgi:hypothetical protein
MHAGPGVSRPLGSGRKSCTFQAGWVPTSVRITSKVMGGPDNMASDSEPKKNCFGLSGGILDPQKIGLLGGRHFY